mmetsp:Transcript_59114/g.68406  ORF Transcript_59114/g.68406 Transcript_59114/m.68406 type:complete len:756 (+) Transcript_59114:26-2293(+)
MSKIHEKKKLSESVDDDGSLGTIIQEQAQKWSPALRMTILLIICIMAILIRVFSVIRYESVIHEFDPWFNYRTTKYLAKEGLYGLWNWFDHESWYPLGRSVGGTVYPGLMTTAAVFYWFAHSIGIPIDIRNVCVFLAPVFAAFTAIAAYLLTKEVTRKSESGLFAALFMAMIPSYLSRSVAGSYDNEGVSIFALVFTFYVYLKAVNTGSILWACNASLAYFYMVSAWGGYAFIINIIPIHAVFLLIVGRFDSKLYVAYSIFYVLGTFMAMQIPFVGFQAIHSSEHLASHGVFFFLQAFMLVNWVRKHVTKSGFYLLIRLFITGIVSVLVFGFLFLTLAGKTKWSGRSMTLLDPTYAKKYIPIIASVSEHQATTWSSFFFDLHYTIMFTPVGLYYCFKKPTATKIFAAIYVVLAVYFASVMVRLLLVLAPAVCVMGGIGASSTIKFFVKSIRGFKHPESNKRAAPFEVSLLGIAFIVYSICIYIFHATAAGAEAYSSPSIILASRDRQGNRYIIDDYREAYYWLRRNTKTDAKIMSWWDYGYQITGMGNRTVLVDNNTWNNSHIATVGLAMSSPEEDAYDVAERLDVDYALVIFGGYSHYSGDDINKFLWMVRIGGGVYPHIKEEDYFSKGQYRIDQFASETMLNCLMYRLSYYRFDEVRTQYNKPAGFDTVRNVEMGLKGFKLRRFEEAFTSESWIVRIYRVLPRENRESITMKPKKLANYPAKDKLQSFKETSVAFAYNKYDDKVVVAKRQKAE